MSPPPSLDQTLLAHIRMRWILFWVFVLLYIVLVAATIHSVFITSTPTPEERSQLFKVFILEIGLGIAALFYNIFSLKNEKSALTTAEATAAGASSTHTAVSDDDKHRFELSPQPERIFTRLAVIFACLSAAITLAEMLVASMPAWSFVLNNFLIFSVLIILTLFFFLRYRQVLADYATQKKNHKDYDDLLKRLISEQSGFYYEVMRDTRQTIYTQFGSGIYPYRFSYRNKKLRGIMERSVEKVVAILMKMITNHFQMLKIDEKISLSVKVQVTGKMVKTLCDMEDKAAALIDPRDHYIITLARDHETATLFTEREVRKEAYPLKDNTDFSHILTGASEFLCNDLRKLEKEGHYTNNNPRWKEWYNATLVVPIMHRATPADKQNIYGFLTVDSLNQSQREIFTRDGVERIMAFGADLLALIFLNLEVFDKIPLEDEAIEAPALPPPRA
ncbi:hypothetical protein [Prosthecobacter vanneervenii]|uniref:Uncharacterized protein n=1 Tax=Prosthecobacter vanneervenii TaxID=48466 RepID=A0A7W7Y8D0_9BACT|nr:hypothetical protein [Prosthecobacter vanneervenii]MBB5031481.1 hypothetical protein [Prosthecobacter vanneervenii]